jgi:hypothetical protein
MVSSLGVIDWGEVGTWTGVALAVVGIFIGTRKIRSRKVIQRQKGGANSTNIQAGRDVKSHKKESG